MDCFMDILTLLTAKKKFKKALVCPKVIKIGPQPRAQKKKKKKKTQFNHNPFLLSTLSIHVITSHWANTLISLLLAWGLLKINNLQKGSSSS